MSAAAGPDIIQDGLVLCLDAGNRESYPVSLPSNGLYGRRYVNYFNDDVNWFETATLHGDVNQLTTIDNFTSNADFYSWQWIGYFKPSTTENYTFFTSSDDASYLWIGNNATTGFTTANANVNNGGLHGDTEQSSTPVSLTKEVYYPIRIQFGENGGGDIMSVSFSTPTISKTRNGLGYYYHGLNTQNTWKDLSNNGNNGTLTNGPLFSEENIGSLVFDGVDDYISSSFATTSNQSVTYAGWLYSTETTATYRNFIDSITVNPMIWWNTSGQIEFDAALYTTSAVYRNQWVYVALSKPSGSSSASYYVNGVLAGTGTAYTTPALTPTLLNRGGGQTWKGNCSNIQIYNRALTAPEVLQNYNATKGRFRLT
jgi:hypothetical protein